MLEGTNEDTKTSFQRSLHVLGRAVLQSHDMNLLKVIVPQLHDILTRLTYDGMVQAVHVLMAFQSCHATHFRTVSDLVLLREL